MLTKIKIRRINQGIPSGILWETFYCRFFFFTFIFPTFLVHFYQLSLLLLLLLLLLLKKVGSASLRESGIHPISPQTPAPQYQPVDRKKRKGKRVEDHRRDRAA